MIVWDISCLHNQYIHLQHLTAAFIFRVTVSLNAQGIPPVESSASSTIAPQCMLLTTCFLILSLLNVKQGTEVHFHFLVPSLASYTAYIECPVYHLSQHSHFYSRIQIELNPLFLWWPLSVVSQRYFATGSLYSSHSDSDSISSSHIEFTLSSQS